MKILFAGGGTAGHINPALAIANFVKEKDPDAEILYVGAKGKMEETLVKKAGFDFKGITISGFSRKKNFEGLKKNFETVKNIVKSSNESRKILKEFSPDICVGTGGYVSGPILWEASKQGIPIIIHEQNAFPGKTTKMLSKKAKVVMLAEKSSEKYFDESCNTIVTGNPIRKEVITETKLESRKKLNLDERPLILSFGGSLGAEKINEAVFYLLKDIAKDDRYQCIHAYGGHEKSFLERFKNDGINLKEHKNFDIREYIDNMPTCLAAADLVICRAGAISLSEIKAQGKASILIPSPNVAENHQYYNAMVLVDNNAANIIEEKNLSGEKLLLVVEEMLKSKVTIEKYQNNAKNMAIIDSCDRIYSIIEKVLN